MNLRTIRDKIDDAREVYRSVEADFVQTERRLHIARYTMFDTTTHFAPVSAADLQRGWDEHAIALQAVEAIDGDLTAKRADLQRASNYLESLIKIQRSTSQQELTK